MTDKLSLDDLLEKMPNDVGVEFFTNKLSTGIVVAWSEKGRGFGEYTLYVNKEDKALSVDGETDSKDTIKGMFDRLVDENPDSVKKMFHEIVDYGKLVG